MAKRAFFVFDFLYKKYLLIFTVILQCSCVIGYDYIHQHSPVHYHAPATFFGVVQCVNIILQYLHILQCMFSDIYRQQSYNYFLMAFFTLIVNFACLYTFLQLSDPNQFSDIRQPQTVYSVLIDMLYFSGITSTLLGFGDIAPLAKTGRVFASFNVLMAVFVLFVIFRGSNFFFR